MIRRTPFDVPQLVFVATAAFGVWIAHDGSAAWTKFWLIIGGVVVFYAFAWLPRQVCLLRRSLDPVAWVAIGLPAVLALYFVLTNDWRAPDSEVVWIVRRLPEALRAPPLLPLPSIHTNTVAGVAAICIPLQIGAFLAGANWRSDKRRLIACIVCVASSLAIIAASRSIGALMALSIVGGAWAARRLVVRLSPRWATAVTALAFAVVLMAVAYLMADRLLVVRDDRYEVWRKSIDLIGDYFLTGVGLNNFVWPYSSYALLVHVPHTYHAHNLYLDLWLNQGVIGLVSFVTMLLIAFRQRNASARWHAAAFASVAVLAVHGLFDDALYGYHDGVGALFMFIPFGVLAQQAPDARRVTAHRLILAGAGVAVVLLATGTALVPPMRAMAYANMGALAQTQTEMRAYLTATKSEIQDVTRVRVGDALAPARAYYQLALNEDPLNVTANRRLGQIELSFREYATARRHLLSAYERAPWQHATRFMLGESYAIDGDIVGALALWRTIDTAKGQLEVRRWWYYDFTQQEDRAAWLIEATQALEGN